MPTESRWHIAAALALFMPVVSISVFATGPSDRRGTPSTVLQPSLVKDLGRNITGLVGKPDLYLLIAGLSTIPGLERRESVDLNEDLHETPNAHRLLRYGNILGNPIIPLAASFASYGVGRWAHSNKLAAFGSDLISAQMLNGALTLSMKVGIARRRPDHSPYSFPSGHSSTAFTTAGVVMRHFGYGWGALAEGVGAYVGVSRLEANKHYLSDVVAGAILGNYIAWRVCRRRSGIERFNLTPAIGGREYGAELTLRF
jgi:membrane-associated phospholipid phosphatase